MPHKTHAARVPSSAQTIVRSGSTAAGSTLYTVPAGKTLVILAAWLCASSTASLAGSATMVAKSEDSDTNADILGVNLPNQASPLTTQANAISGAEIRVKAGNTVTTSGTNLSAFNYGFSGYLENA